MPIVFLKTISIVKSHVVTPAKKSDTYVTEWHFCTEIKKIVKLHNTTH